MYKKFFGLRESPFKVNPDPRYLFLTPGIQEALASLAYGIRGRRGIILLTGEVGTGKTTLLKMVLDWLRQNRAATAFASLRFAPASSTPTRRRSCIARCRSTRQSSAGPMSWRPSGRR